MKFNLKILKEFRFLPEVYGAIDFDYFQFQNLAVQLGAIWFKIFAIWFKVFFSLDVRRNCEYFQF